MSLSQRDCPLGNSLIYWYQFKSIQELSRATLGRRSCANEHLHPGDKAYTSGHKF